MNQRVLDPNTYSKSQPPIFNSLWDGCEKNMLIVSVLGLMLIGSLGMAYTPSVIGGARDGVALGIVLENGLSARAAIRLGLEANTSDSRGIIFLGGKWLVTDMDNGNYPMYLSAGLMGSLGTTSEIGPFVSLIFERFLDIPPLYLEVGVDAIKSGRLQFQVGYKF